MLSQVSCATNKKERTTTTKPKLELQKAVLKVPVARVTIQDIKFPMHTASALGGLARFASFLRSC
jgi:hypothetical protein